MTRKALFTIACAGTGVCAFVACIEDERLPAFVTPVATPEAGAGAEGGAKEAGGDFVCGLISVSHAGSITCPSKTKDTDCSTTAGCCPGEPGNECVSTCSNGAHSFGCFSNGQCTGTNRCCVAGAVVPNLGKVNDCEDSHAVAADAGAVTVCKSTCGAGEVELCDTQGDTCPAPLKCVRTTYVIPGSSGTTFTRAVGTCQLVPDAGQQ